MPSPEHEAIVAAMQSQPAPETPPTPQESRAGFAAQFEGQALPAGISTQPADAAGVPAEWIAPVDADPQRSVLYLHGGGYLLGSVATHRGLVGRIAQASQARCLSIDYRLAPENPFPAAVEDAVAAYRWLLAGGADPAHLAIAGDSAGGGLALGTLAALRQAGDPLPAAAVCLSPLTDLEGTGDSLATADDPMLGGGEALAGMAQAYLQGADPRDPRAAPLHADYAGFPPLQLLVGTREALLDDSTRVAARARAAGVEVELFVGEGLIHVWPLFGPDIPEALDAYRRIGAFLAKHL